MPRDDDPPYEYRVLHGPNCRVLASWTFPMADASALIACWQRDGYRHGSTALAHKWRVAFVALRDPAGEEAADAWWAARENPPAP